MILLYIPSSWKQRKRVLHIAKDVVNAQQAQLMKTMATKRCFFVKTFVLSLEAYRFHPNRCYNRIENHIINNWWKFEKDLTCFQRTTNYFANVSDFGCEMTLFFLKTFVYIKSTLIDFSRDHKLLLQSNRGLEDHTLYTIGESLKKNNDKRCFFSWRHSFYLWEKRTDRIENRIEIE